MIRWKIINRRALTKFRNRLLKFGTSAALKRDISTKCAQVYRIALRDYIYTTRFAPLRDSTLAIYGISKKPGKVYYATLIRTGAYINSITIRVAGKNALVMTNIIYSEYHEFGTRKMVARPHWLPALNRCIARGDFNKVIEECITKYLTK